MPLDEAIETLCDDFPHLGSSAPLAAGLKGKVIRRRTYELARPDFNVKEMK
jgi:hypothetical protein